MVYPAQGGAGIQEIWGRLWQKMLVMKMWFTKHTAYYGASVANSENLWATIVSLLHPFCILQTLPNNCSFLNRDISALVQGGRKAGAKT